MGMSYPLYDQRRYTYIPRKKKQNCLSFRNIIKLLSDLLSDRQLKQLSLCNIY